MLRKFFAEVRTAFQEGRDDFNRNFPETEYGTPPQSAPSGTRCSPAHPGQAGWKRLNAPQVNLGSSRVTGTGFGADGTPIIFVRDLSTGEIVASRPVEDWR